jgi:hypothetical protein
LTFILHPEPKQTLDNSRVKQKSVKEKKHLEKHIYQQGFSKIRNGGSHKPNNEQIQLHEINFK